MCCYASIRNGRAAPIPPNLSFVCLLHSTIDFGLSGCVGDNNRQNGNLRCMAPEVYNGQASSTKSDIYSFAITIYELYTKTRPFKHLSSSAAALEVATNNLRPPSDWNIPHFLFRILKASCHQPSTCGVRLEWYNRNNINVNLLLLLRSQEMWSSNVEERPELHTILPTFSSELSLMKEASCGVLKQETINYSSFNATNYRDLGDPYTYFNCTNPMEPEHAMDSSNHYSIFSVDCKASYSSMRC